MLLIQDIPGSDLCTATKLTSAFRSLSKSLQGSLRTVRKVVPLLAYYVTLCVCIASYWSSSSPLPQSPSTAWYNSFRTCFVFPFIPWSTYVSSSYTNLETTEAFMVKKRRAECCKINHSVSQCDNLTSELSDQLTSAQQCRSYERHKVSMTQVSAHASVSWYFL